MIRGTLGYAFYFFFDKQRICIKKGKTPQSIQEEYKVAKASKNKDKKITSL